MAKAPTPFADKYVSRKEHEAVLSSNLSLADEVSRLTSNNKTLDSQLGSMIAQRDNARRNYDNVDRKLTLFYTASPLTRLRYLFTGRLG